MIDQDVIHAIQKVKVPPICPFASFVLSDYDQFQIGPSMTLFHLQEHHELLNDMPSCYFHTHFL